MASPATLVLPDLLDSPEHLVSPALVEAPRHPESLDLLEHPETTELLASQVPLDNPASLHPTKPKALHLLAHQETLEHLDSPETLELLDSLVAPAPLARRDRPVALDSPEVPDSPDRPDSLASPDLAASAVSAPSTVPSTAECSSRTAPEDVEAESGTDEAGSTTAKISRFHTSAVHSSHSLFDVLPIAAVCFICSFSPKKSKTANPR